MSIHREMRHCANLLVERIRPALKSESLSDLVRIREDVALYSAPDSLHLVCVLPGRRAWLLRPDAHAKEAEAAAQLIEKYGGLVWFEHQRERVLQVTTRRIAKRMHLPRQSLNGDELYRDGKLRAKVRMHFERGSHEWLARAEVQPAGEGGDSLAHDLELLATLPTVAMWEAQRHQEATVVDILVGGEPLLQVIKTARRAARQGTAVAAEAAL